MHSLGELGYGVVKGLFILVAPFALIVFVCAAWGLLKDIVEIILTDPGDGRKVPPAR